MPLGLQRELAQKSAETRWLPMLRDGFSIWSRGVMSRAVALLDECKDEVSGLSRLRVTQLSRG